MHMLVLVTSLLLYLLLGHHGSQGLDSAEMRSHVESAGLATGEVVSPVHQRVVVSVSVFEPLNDVVELVQNYLKFTEPSTIIVLHLNSQSNYTLEDVDTLLHLGKGTGRSTKEGRVYVNPTRLPVSWGTADILRSFLMNVKYTASQFTWQRGKNEPVVIWMDSNMMFFRPCVEAYVRRHSCARAALCQDCSRCLSTMQKLFGDAVRCYPGPHEGSYYRISAMLHLKAALDKADEWKRIRFQENVMTMSHSNWVSSNAGRNCTGERISRFDKSNNGPGTSKLGLNIAEEKVHRPTEFAYKRVPRSREIAMGYNGLSPSGELQGNSRKIDVKHAKAIREYFTNLPESHNCAAAEGSGS